MFYRQGFGGPSGLTYLCSAAGNVRDRTILPSAAHAHRRCCRRLLAAACRPLRPCDYPALKLLHQRLFPLDYDDDFFVRAVHGMDDIVAWSAAAQLPALTHFALGVDDLAPQLLPPTARPQQDQLGKLDGSSKSSSVDTGGAGAPPAELLAGFITGKACECLQDFVLR